MRAFTKTFRTLNTRRKPNEDAIYKGNTFLGGDIKAIKFYGHSLGAADYSYFQAIFDRVDLYGGSTTLIFFLRNAGAKESAVDYASYKERFYEKIADLLDEYGKTLLNEDHGKNLMHKLILEDRLFFRVLENDAQ